MKTISRRGFLAGSLACGTRLLADNELDIGDRIRGLLYGTMLGDAFGGPIEFQPKEAAQNLAQPSKHWLSTDQLDQAAKLAAAERLVLRPYAPLRPLPESYGHWRADAPPGTITDDSRWKLLLLHMLARAEKEGSWPISERALAQAILDWPNSDSAKTHPEYAPLVADWLEEYQISARWILGERDLKIAGPPQRMWVSLPTCMGQMVFPPLAALFAGEPERAYRTAHALGWIDNGFGRDLNAALVAGLAAALVAPSEGMSPRQAWEPVLRALLQTDPYGYGKVRWTQRAADRWFGVAKNMAKEARGRPAELFRALEAEFQYTTKWEAQVPFVVIFSCLEIADYDPLCALQLSMEWGHDTDSYPQLLGAFIGALHGSQLFRREWRETLAARLKDDFAVDIEEQCRLLSRLREKAKTREMVREE